MRIGWICLSGIGASESFLHNTLDTLGEIGEVCAVSGVSDGERKSIREHHYIPFAEHPLTLLHTLRRKLTGRNVHRKQVQARCRKMTQAVWDGFNPDVFWIEFGTSAVAAKQTLERAQKPYFIAVHGYDITTEFKDEDYRRQWVELVNHDLCIAVVCASHYTKRLCVLAGAEEQKCQVIRLALDGEKIQRDPSIQKTSHPSFVHFGRLTEKKNPIATFEAFRLVVAKAPNATITFIGDGPMREELEARVSRSGLDSQVRILGAMKQELALQEVQRHWIFVQHSVTAKSGDQEGFALSPAEAALMEMPVVSTLHNGIPEHVLEGETGFLVREFDYESMAERMIELAADENQRTLFGLNGRRNVLKICAPEQRRLELLKLLEKLSKL